MPLPPGHCVKLEALAGFRGWPHLPPCSNLCLVSTGGCASQKNLSLAGHWEQKGVTGTRAMTSKLLVHFRQAQGGITPAARYRVPHITLEVPGGTSDQQAVPSPAVSTHRVPPDSTLHSSSPAPPPWSTLNTLNFHRRRICKSSSSQAHAPADFTNLILTFARWVFCSLLGKGWDNGATNRKNARNGLSYWAAPVLSPKMW